MTNSVYSIGSKPSATGEVYATLSPAYVAYKNSSWVDEVLVKELLNSHLLAFTGFRASAKIYDPTSLGVETCKGLALIGSAIICVETGMRVVPSEEEEIAELDRQAGDPDNDIFYPR